MAPAAPAAPITLTMGRNAATGTGSFSVEAKLTNPSGRSGEGHETIDRFLLVADALAQAHDARIRVLTAMGPDGSDDETGTVQAFHDRLVEHCNSPTSREIIRPENVVSDLVTAAGNTDLAIVGTMARSRLRDFFSTNRTTALLEALPCDCFWCVPNGPARTPHPAASSAGFEQRVL